MNPLHKRVYFTFYLAVALIFIAIVGLVGFTCIKPVYGDGMTGMYQEKSIDAGGYKITRFFDHDKQITCYVVSNTGWTNTSPAISCLK